MNYTLREARRGNAKPLIGLYGESGSGKTWSALLMARGFVGPSGKIGMIETEGGRGEVYTGAPPVGDYLVCPLVEPFSPSNYGDAISACEKAGVDALIIDSGSHEWEAVGGVLDMAAENEAKGWKGQIVWTKPKLEHSRHFLLRFGQTKIPLVIVCLRSKFPLEEYIDEKGKKNMRRMKIPVPIQSDTFISEMLIHGWIDKAHNFHVTKYPDAVPELAGVVVNGQPISIEAGARLGRWASGAKETATAAPNASTEGSPVTGEPLGAQTAATLTPDEVTWLEDELKKAGKTTAQLLAAMKAAGMDVQSLAKMPAKLYARATAWVERQKVPS